MNKKNLKKVTLALLPYIFVIFMLGLGYSLFLKLKHCDQTIQHIDNLSNKRNNHIQFYRIYELIKWDKKEKNLYLKNHMKKIDILNNRYKDTLQSFSKECNLKPYKALLAIMLLNEKENYKFNKNYFKDVKNTDWIDSWLASLMNEMNVMHDKKLLE